MGTFSTEGEEDDEEEDGEKTWIMVLLPVSTKLPYR